MKPKVYFTKRRREQIQRAGVILLSREFRLSFFPEYVNVQRENRGYGCFFVMADHKIDLLGTRIEYRMAVTDEMMREVIKRMEKGGGP